MRFSNFIKVESLIYTSNYCQLKYLHVIWDYILKIYAKIIETVDDWANLTVILQGI